LADYCARAATHPLHRDHHDREHGFSPADDAGWLERLSWEIGQAGISWLVVLAKREATHRAFDGFELDRVAGYGSAEVERLLADPGVVRHRGKILAVIHNAGAMRRWRDAKGSVRAWLAANRPATPEGWLRLLKRELRFIGPEIAREWLEGTGVLPGAHRPDCPMAARAAASGPLWLESASTRRQAG
jgi:DNA-3-methyladenine glycosylase I